jgi:hypothetical protein
MMRKVTAQPSMGLSYRQCDEDAALGKLEADKIVPAARPDKGLEILR